VTGGERQCLPKKKNISMDGEGAFLGHKKPDRKERGNKTRLAYASGTHLSLPETWGESCRSVWIKTFFEIIVNNADLVMLSCSKNSNHSQREQGKKTLDEGKGRFTSCVLW